MKGLPDCFLFSPGLYGYLVVKGASDQLPLDPLPKLFPSFFLPSELSSSLVSLANVSNLCVDIDRSGLLLAFGLLECSDLRELCLFFFNFFFRSWTCCLRASMVSRFLSSVVRLVEEMLFLAP